MKSLYFVLLLIALVLQATSSSNINNKRTSSVLDTATSEIDFFSLSEHFRNHLYSDLGSYIQTSLVNTAQSYLMGLNSDDFDGRKGLTKAGLKSAIISALFENFCDKKMTLPCDKINQHRGIKFRLDCISSEMKFGQEYANLVVQVTMTEWFGRKIGLWLLLVIELKYIKGGRVKSMWPPNPDHHYNRRLLTQLAETFKGMSYENILDQKYFVPKLQSFASIRNRFVDPKIEQKNRRFAKYISSIPELKNYPVAGISLLGAVNRIYSPTLVLLKGDSIIPPVQSTAYFPLGQSAAVNHVPSVPLGTIQAGSIEKSTITAEVNRSNRLAAYNTSSNESKLINEFIFTQLGDHIRKTLEKTTEKYLSVMKRIDFDGRNGLTETDFKAVVLSALFNNFCEQCSGKQCAKENTFVDIKFRLDTVISEYMVDYRYADIFVFVTITEYTRKKVNMDFILIIELKYIRAGYVKNVWQPGLDRHVLNESLTQCANQFKKSTLAEILDQEYLDPDLNGFQSIREKLNGDKLRNQIKKYVLGISRQYENTQEKNLNDKFFAVLGFGLVGAVNRVISSDYAYYKANIKGTSTDLTLYNWDQ